MINLKLMRETIAQGLSEYLGIKVIRGNQTAPAPPYPYCSYNLTTPAGENHGTWQEHEDGIDRLMVKSTWSMSFLSGDFDESIEHALRAREWFTHSGRGWLSMHGIIVQSCTQITNRDNILTVEYERKNGFDVFFYVYDEVQNLSETVGIIEGAELARTMKE